MEWIRPDMLHPFFAEGAPSKSRLIAMLGFGPHVSTYQFSRQDMQFHITA